ncbi:MAG: helix-hairpin-helix domain-containing protein [Elusimicrobiota bacterium]
MRKLVLVLVGIMILAVPMVHAEKTEGNYTRAEAIDDLNTLSAAALDALNVAGCGATMAANIVAYRDVTPFVAIEDLGNVSGIAVPGTYYDNFRTFFWGTDMIPNDEGGGGVGDLSASVEVTASVAGITSLTVTDTAGADGVVSFGTLTSAYTKAPESITVGISSNYGSWELEIYTDNFPSTTPSTSTWGLAYGGMIDASQGTRVPLGWCAFEDATWGDAEAPSTDKDNMGRWMYVKDQSDLDDPAATGDQSWAGRGGYANIAWGIPGTSYVVNPYNTGGDPQYTDAMAGDDFNLYLETAGSALPGTYSSTVYLDLINE